MAAAVAGIAVFAMGDPVSEVRLVSWEAEPGRDYVVRTHAKTSDD